MPESFKNKNKIVSMIHCYVLYHGYYFFIFIIEFEIRKYFGRNIGMDGNSNFSLVILFIFVECLERLPKEDHIWASVGKIFSPRKSWVFKLHIWGEDANKPQEINASDVCLGHRKPTKVNTKPNISLEYLDEKRPTTFMNQKILSKNAAQEKQESNTKVFQK